MNVRSRRCLVSLDGEANGHYPRRRAALVAALLAFTSLPGTACGQAVTGLVTGQDYAPMVTAAARRFAIPQAWIWQVMRTESAGNLRAVSPKGAMGLMQLMPGTWAMLTARYGLGSDPFDAAANIHAGAAYLREMFDRYGDLGAALAAYNAGPGRVDDWRRTGRPLPAETIAYVARIAPALGSPKTANADPSDWQPRAVRPAVSWRGSGLFASQAVASVSGQDAGLVDTAVPAAAAEPAPVPAGSSSLGGGGLFVTRPGPGLTP